MDSQVKAGYKQTEVGVIPEDWNIKSINEVCSKVVDCSHSTPKWTDQGFIVLRNQNIRNGRLDLSEPSFTDELHFIHRIQRAKPSHNDLVITREAPMGEVCIIPKNFICCLGQRMVLLRPNTDLIYSKYLLYIIQSSTVQNQIRVEGGTGSTVSNLRIPVLCKLSILYPPIAEQEKIAEALSDVDSLIEALEDLIAKKRNIKQGAMQELLTGKRRLSGFGQNTGYKQTELGLIPEDWNIAPLPNLIWFQEGPGLRNWQFKPQGLKVINVTNLQENGFLDLSKTDRYISIEEFERTYKHFLIDEDDVVMASSGNSYCKVSIVKKCDLPLLMNTSVIRFKPKEKMNRLFMLIYLKSKYFKNQIDLMITGGAQPNFGPFHLNKVMILIPPTKAEQEAIAEVLTDMDNEITALEEKLQKTRHLKQGMMQELLTGKTRLI